MATSRGDSLISGFLHPIPPLPALGGLLLGCRSSAGLVASPGAGLGLHRSCARGSSALQNTAKSVGDSGKSVIKSRSSGSLMLRKLPVHITDRPQNARLSLLLFLASSCFYSCSLLFPLIWSRCCSCGKMEVCMFYEGEASLTMRAWLLAGCWRGLCAGLSSPGGAWVMLDPSPGHHAAGEGWHETRSAWFQHQK